MNHWNRCLQLNYSGCKQYTRISVIDQIDIIDRERLFLSVEQSFPASDGAVTVLPITMDSRKEATDAPSEGRNWR
jgi:hypothetical protein